MFKTSVIMVSVGLLASMLPPAAAQTASGQPSTVVAVQDGASAAAAQSTPPTSTIDNPAQSANAEGASQIGEIVVTATRRSENLQKVPITMSAFKGETLTTLGIKSNLDLPQLTPGLSFTRTLVGVNAFMRGVGTTTAGYSTEVPIATYIDGLYLPNSAAASFSFNNIERIEVLKGPQGTLYGRNTTGGLIHVITKEPDDITRVDASVGYASYDTVNFNFYGSTPLTDTLAANFAATYINQGNGWGQNIGLNTDAFKIHDIGFQGKLKWQPAAATTITLRGFYDNLKSDQGNAAAIFPGSVANDGTSFLGKYQIKSRIAPFVEQRQYNISLKAEQDLTFATLTSITGYINNLSPSFSIQNAAFGNLVPGQGAVNLGGYQTAKTFSQELQLASNPSASALKWMTGLFYYRDDSLVRTEVFGTCVASTCVPPAPFRTSGFANTRSLAGFGEGTYNLTPATAITLGLRYTRDEKTLTGLLEPIPGFPNSFPAFPPGAVTRPGDPFAGFPNGIPTAVTFGKLTSKAVLAHDLTRDVHAYMSFNRGFKSGGYNPIAFTNPPSRPEVLDAYEVGVKSELFDRSLRLNVAGFYYDYKDIQLRSTAPPALPGGSILFNAASAHMRGIDADFLLAVVKGLTVNGGLEYLDAKYAAFPGGTCTSPRLIGGPVLGGVASVPCDLSGKRPPSAPKFSFNLGATYTFNTQVGTFALTANDSYKSSYFWESDNRLKQDAYHLINASLTWTANDPRYSVQLFGRNLGDKYYFASGAEGSNDAYLPAAPRTYGVKMSYRY